MNRTWQSMAWEAVSWLPQQVAATVAEDGGSPSGSGARTTIQTRRGACKFKAHLTLAVLAGMHGTGLRGGNIQEWKSLGFHYLQAQLCYCTCDGA